MAHINTNSDFIQNEAKPVNLSIRIFENKYDNKGKEKTFDSFSESINYLDSPFNILKPRTPHILKTKDTARAVIFGITNDQGRCTKNGEILTRNALTIDIDKVELADDEDIKLYETIVAKLTEKLDHNFYIYTTSGSSLASPKFRVIVPLSYPISASEYPKIIKNYIGIHIDNLKFKIDVSCYEASRIMFVPFIPSNEYIAFSCNETDRKSINPSDYIFDNKEHNNVKLQNQEFINKDRYSEEYVDYVIDRYDVSEITSYRDWFLMGAAFHHWDNVKGLDKFLKISAKDPRYKTDPNKFNNNEVKKQYERYNDEKSKLVTFAYIDAKFTRQKEKYLDEYLMLPTSTQKNDIELDKLKNLFNVKTRKDIDIIIKERREFNILKDESNKITGLNDIIYNGDVDAAVVLDEIEKFIKERAVLPDGSSAIITLWILQSYFQDILYTVSYLGINAPERSCGKSRVLELLISFVKSGYQTTQISAATLYRFIEENKVTLLIDECDSFIKSDNGMANALNAGYKRGNTALKTNMENKGIVEKFDPFCAKVLCAINLHKVLPDTTISRTIVIPMRRKKTTDNIKRFRPAAILNPEHKEFKYLADKRSKLLKIAEDNREKLKDILENFDDEYCNEFFDQFEPLNDRIKDNYEFLVILAKLVGGGWYEKLQYSFKIFSKVEINNDNLHSWLLQDIYRLFKTKYKNQTFIKTDDLIKDLCEIDESPWKEFKAGVNITPKKVAELLNSYGIKSQQNEKKSARGYKFKDFEDSFDSYCSHIIIDENPDDETPEDQDPNDPKGGGKSETEPLSIDEHISTTDIEPSKDNIVTANTTINYELKDKAHLIEFLQTAEKSITYGLDIETTGLKASKHEIALIQIYNPNLDKVFIYKVFDSPLTKEEKKLLSEINFVAHNASFERSFMPYLKNLNCSMIAYHAATSKRRCGLSDLTPYTGITYNNKKVMQVSIWTGELTDEQLEYAAKDAKATYILWQKYKDVNKPVYDRMYTASFIIDDYARRGLPVDTEALRNLRIEKENKRDELLKKLTALGFSDVITPNNNIRTKKEVMDKVTPDVMKIVEEVRKTNSLINNIIKGVEENIVDGRLPINVLICGTETGRLSTVNPNVQNFPRSGFRHIFKARDGYRFVRADFSGQELRMVAAMSNEKVLIEAFNSGKDPHAIMAARLNNMLLKTFLEQPIDWQKSERQKAKAANFGFLYGMGASRFIVNAKEAYNVDLTLAEANNIRTKFWATYSFLKKWSDKEREECKARRYALTRGGRKRYFEDIDNAYCEMINTAVQGSCGEVLLETLIALPDYLKGYLVNTVHDELIFEVPIEFIKDEARYTELKNHIIGAMIMGVNKVEKRYPTLNITEIKDTERLDNIPKTLNGINTESVNVVSTNEPNKFLESDSVPANQLHKFLEIEMPLYEWVEEMIKDLRFKDGIDFITHKGLNHIFTYEAALEIGMVTETKKGNEVREYLLECEEKLNELRDHKISLSIPPLDGTAESTKELKAWVDQILLLQKTEKELSDPKEKIFYWFKSV